MSSPGSGEPPASVAERESWRRRDELLVWHPATHFRDLDQLPPIFVRSARGAYLEAADGSQIYDAISSWWTCLHGHGHPKLVQAIAEQAQRLDHVMFAGFTHEPAVRLAERLVAAAPGGEAAYERVFYADCGSAAIEVALKMSFQARQQSGEPERQGVATLSNSYHGETLGALAVSGNPAYRARFQQLLFPVLELTAPSFESHELDDLAHNLGEDAPETQRAIASLEAHHGQLTALLIEPIIQCAGRMVMPGVGFYRAVCDAAQRLGIHVIADEIAVGFGRTGRMFASEWGVPTEQANVAPGGWLGAAPDFLCLSKGLSGGVLPLSAVLIRRGFDQAFRGDPSRSFLHSHTFTANPITCAAGLASLELFEAEGTLDRVATLARELETLRRQVATACGAHVGPQRQAGLVAALEVTPDPDWEGRFGPGRLSLELRAEALKRGVLLRPLNDTVYWMPPYCSTSADLERLAEVTASCISQVLG